METKSIGSNGKDFCTVATPNREKLKEEDYCKLLLCNSLMTKMLMYGLIQSNSNTQLAYSEEYHCKLSLCNSLMTKNVNAWIILI